MKTKILLIIALQALMIVNLSAQTKIYSSDEVDEKPVFLDTFDQTTFMLMNRTYPYGDSIVDESVMVRFIITKTGTIKKLEIEEDWGTKDTLYREEALRIVRLMKKWRPARKDNKPVDMYYNVNVYWHNIEYPDSDN